MSEELTLPDKPIPVTNKDPRTLLIYGSPKIGKTTLTSGLADNLIVDIEGGSKFVEALKVEPDNPNELMNYVNQLKKDNKYTFTTLDTITKLEEWAEKVCTIEYKKTPQGKNWKGGSVLELDYGAGYGMLRTKMRKYLYDFSKTSEHTILVGHVKDKMINKGKEEVSVKDINLTGQIKAIVTADVDAVGYIYLDPEDSTKRIITFFTSDDVVCGNRCPHLEGKSFIISEKDEDGNIITHWNKIYSFLNK